MGLVASQMSVSLLFCEDEVTHDGGRCGKIVTHHNKIAMKFKKALEELYNVAACVIPLDLAVEIVKPIAKQVSRSAGKLDDGVASAAARMAGVGEATTSRSDNTNESSLFCPICGKGNVQMVPCDGCFFSDGPLPGLFGPLINKTIGVGSVASTCNYCPSCGARFTGTIPEGDTPFYCNRCRTPLHRIFRYYIVPECEAKGIGSAERYVRRAMTEQCVELASIFGE